MKWLLRTLWAWLRTLVGKGGTDFGADDFS